MARNLDDLNDEPLDDNDFVLNNNAHAEEFSGRIAELLSDRLASPRTIELLESFEEQLKERGWLSARQRELIEAIENRRFTSRSGRF